MMVPGSLAAFYQGLAVRRLPCAIGVGKHRCLFLDLVSAGAGGPDFRLGDDQLAWAGHELQQAAARDEDAVVFMHTCPAGLRGGAERLGAVLDQPHVRCVDMGRTHYNGLANDGSAIFMATRSTGQIECDTPDGRVRVEARDARGRFDADLVELARSGCTLPERIADGSDRDRVGAWSEKGILGTQLGPNRNGRHR